MNRRAAVRGGLAGMAALLLPLMGRTFAVEVRNVSDDLAAVDLSFGEINVAASHHTALQYLDIQQSNLTTCTVYVYTNNGAVLGIPKAGLVATDGTAVPFYYRVYDEKPPSGAFLPEEQDLWSAVLESSDPAFATSKSTGALVPPGPDGRTAVFLGVTLATSTTAGGYQAKLVIEEFSLVDDVAGPVVQHVPSPDIILTGIPVGIEASLVDDSVVVGSTLHYRLDGETVYREANMALTPPGSLNPSWQAVGVLEPSELIAGGVLEYYFTAVDQFGNTGQSSAGPANPYRTNLFAPTVPVARDLPVEGGVVEYVVGDPRLPGLALTFPAGSLSTGGTMTASLEPVDTLPVFQSQSPARVYEFLPDGLRFLLPVTLDLPYADSDQDGLVDGTGVNESDLRVFWFDGFAWRYVGGQVDGASNRVRASVTHFSLYGLFPMATLSEDEVRPKEKIITPNGDGINDWATFASGFEIEIFDIRGSLVRRLNNVSEWDGRNDDGDVVESGTYVYRVEGQGMTVTGMIAVAR